MRIPTVNDEMWCRVEQVAESPIVVLFTAADDRRNEPVVRLMELAADYYSDQIVFLRIWFDEHEALARAAGIEDEQRCPVLPAWHKREQVGRIAATLCAATIRDWLEGLVKRVS